MQYRSYALRMARMTFVFVFLLSLLGVSSVQAQDRQPPQPPIQPAGQPAGDPGPALRAAQPNPGTAVDPQTGHLYHKADAGQPGRSEMMTASGGPDYYGYTWSSATYSWIDAVTGGKKTSLTDYSWPVQYSMPFAFKFYENTYNQIYIATPGFLTFTNPYSMDDQSQVPDASSPNNVIAPYWTPISMDNGGGVYYKSGGTSPNRYFVVEWHNVHGGPAGSWSGDEFYDFEAILYEKGDITFQYKQMTYNGANYYLCGYSGIEDFRGTDGLASKSDCSEVASKTAIRFTRPQPTARVLLDASRYGGFGPVGGQAVIPIQLTNIGDLGSDAFDIQVSCSWPVSLFDASTGEELEDTSGNGTLDTGPVPQGGSKTIQAKISIPDPANVGMSSTCYFQALPGRNPTKSRFFPVSAAVPAPFWQTYGENTDGSLSLNGFTPDTQSKQKLGTGIYGYVPAVAELGNGNLMTVWTKGRCISNCSKYVDELFYTIRSRSGATVKGITQLTNLGTTPKYAYDYDPSIAVAPDGTIGIAWVRELVNTSYKYNRNVYFARLTSTGSPIGAPVNITNDTSYADYYALNHHMFYNASISATGDNRFVMAWLNEYQNSAGYVDNLYTAIYSSAGAKLVSPKALTADTAGSDQGYFTPSLTRLDNNRALLVYYDVMHRDIFYQVLGSDGSVVKAATNLSADGTYYYDSSPHAVQLSNGTILVAWETGQVSYATLDSSYNPSSEVKRFDRFSSGWEGGVSVTADQAGNGILTWSDSGQQYLYYALVDSGGNLTTPNMSFAHTSGQFYLDNTGQLTTSYTITPSTTNTDLSLGGSSGAVALAGGTKTFQVNFKNLGALGASTVTISMSKPAGLIFDTVSPDAACDDSACTWTLTDANLNYLGGGSIKVEYTVPGDSPAGTAYPVVFHISAPEVDDIAANNDLTVNVYSGIPFFIPAAMK